MISALLFLAVVAFLIAKIRNAMRQYDAMQPPPPPQELTLEDCVVNGGTMVVVVVYQSHPHLPALETTIRRWAIRLTDPSYRDELYDSLARELTPFQAIPKKISVDLGEQVKTLEEQEVAKFKGKDKAARSLAEVAGVDLEDINGVPLKVRQQRHIEETIEEFYANPNHIRD